MILANRRIFLDCIGLLRPLYGWAGISYGFSGCCQGKKAMTSYDLGGPVTLPLGDFKTLLTLRATGVNTGFYQIALGLSWSLENYLQRLLST